MISLNFIALNEIAQARGKPLAYRLENKEESKTKIALKFAGISAALAIFFYWQYSKHENIYNNFNCGKAWQEKCFYPKALSTLSLAAASMATYSTFLNLYRASVHFDRSENTQNSLASKHRIKVEA